MTKLGAGLEERLPRVIKANNLLQQKVGTGKIDPFVLEKIQSYLDSVTIDFNEIAEPHLIKIKMLMDEAGRSPYGREDFIEEMVKPIMELKATGGVFNEPVIANVSGMVLGILENVRRLDDDMLDILRSHNIAINTIVHAGIRNVDDRRAIDLMAELKQACMRYYNRTRAASMG